MKTIQEEFLKPRSSQIVGSYDLFSQCFLLVSQDCINPVSGSFTFPISVELGNEDLVPGLIDRQFIPTKSYKLQLKLRLDSDLWTNARPEIRLEY